MEELDITDDSIVGDGGESKETLEALANLAGTTGKANSLYQKNLQQD